MTRTVSAGWSLDRLVSALARAAWAELEPRAASGLRTVLRGLVDVLPHGSASGQTTAHQLADTTGLSERWVRRCLALLEDMGLITWTRGYILAGEPVPSIIRVSKRALADLVNRARRAMPERLQQRADELAARVRETIRTRSTRKQPGPAKTLVKTAELSTAPSPSREETDPLGEARYHPDHPSPPSSEARPRGWARQALRAAIAAQQKATA